MAEQYDILPAPIKTHEAVEAVAALIRQGAVSDGKAGFTVYDHEQPSDVPDRFCVVREPVIPGGRRSSPSRYVGMIVQVMFEVRKGKEADIRKWLADAHAWARTKLIGQSPTFTSGESVLPVEQYTDPTAAAYDADTDTYYSTAEVLLALRP